MVFFFIFLLVVAADQLGKTWVRSYPQGRTIFESGFFHLVHAQNTGAAFGLFQGQSFLLTIFGLIAVALLLSAFFFGRSALLAGRLSRTALTLILGGAVGNLIERLRLGYVTDFIDVSVWPAFNIADSAITVGVILIAYSLFRSTKAGDKTGGNQPGN